MKDSNQYPYGRLQGNFYANGTVGVTLQTNRVINNTYYQNNLNLQIRKDGTPSIEVAHPWAWRRALEVYKHQAYISTLRTDQYGAITVPQNIQNKTIVNVRVNDYRYGCFYAGSQVRVFRIDTNNLAWVTNTNLPFIFIYLD